MKKKLPYYRGRLAVLAISALILWVLPAGVAAASNHFYFVQITDTHFGDRDHSNRLAEVVRQINALPLPIECVVHTGDITSERTDDGHSLAEALAILRRLRAPVHWLPGNHDIVRSRFDSTYAAYTNVAGAICGRAEYHGVVFLLLYTEPLRREVTVPGYAPLEWLAAALRDAGTKPVVVFHHAPEADDFYNNRMHPGWAADVRREWIAQLRSANVKGVITGHCHRDELHWLDRVPLFVCGAVSTEWNRQSVYRIYEYDDGRIGYRTQYLDWPLNP